MKYDVQKIEFWSGEVRDAIGGLATALAPVVEAGANFSYVIARRQPDKPGTGHVFFAGVNGAKQTKAAQAAGFIKADLPGLRVETADKPGTTETIVTRLAEAGINLRGVTASGAGAKCSVILAFDSTKDRDKAVRLLRG
jgi:ACT domain-containing protein